MSLSCRLGHHGRVRVLVVEDQKTLANRIAEGLRDQGMAVDVAYDGASAVEVTALNRYDVVVLDRDLPRVHGDAVCASLVSGPSPARILMLTAAATVDDRVDGLNLGANDYLPPPGPSPRPRLLLPARPEPPAHASRSSATARSTCAIFLPSRASGCRPRR